ncbi:hypothetical protein [Paenibacillus woosongensis]|uniref:Uncharacterized protein n=1 Tax=Paenibacillus woosongensis TaxID=307580 RepID=A0ABQ4MP11_9BACL|nr:hypothetical protein [Paenibacillus woosongensis]GIP57683.1 hypothetical protein J15TS10_14970 [Paenibacillus woosongensis]
MFRKTLLKLSVLLLVATTILTACGGNNAGGNPANTTGNGAADDAKKEVAFTIGYASGDPATKKSDCRYGQEVYGSESSYQNKGFERNNVIGLPGLVED